jgi:hypothetical protein
MDVNALYTPPRFIAGLDVGQMADPTALAILERHLILQAGAMQPRFDARYLERVPLQTPYPVMVRGVRERLECLGERCVLVIDATGVGRGIVDLFREAWSVYHAATDSVVTMPSKPTVIAITLTNAEQARNERADEWYVPKRDVIMTFMVTLQQQRFRVAKDLPEAETLFKEGLHFQWKVSKAGNDLYGAWREGQYDDLLLAVAIGVWWGERYVPKALAGGQQYAKTASNPYARSGQVAATGWGGRR